VPRRFVAFLAVFQTVLVLVHFFLYMTWTYFWQPAEASGIAALQIVFAILSVSFLAASLLAFRFNNGLLRAFYTVTAVWLGTVNYGFFAACGSWAIYGAFRLGGLSPERRVFAIGFVGAALLMSAYGVINAAVARVTRITVGLPNLPESWRGRAAVLVSDLHLGHVRSYRFARRVVRKIATLRPDVVFLAGDLYDGTAADFKKLAGPWSDLAPALGSYFAEGNHEEFSDNEKYLRAVAQAGVRVLDNERVVVDGLQLIGIAYRDATHGEHFRKTLRGTGLDHKQPSILLTHAPDPLAVAAEEGISLQLSGHTHRGQFLPWTWVAARMYGPYVYGLHRIGESLIYTTSGVGTWGPPMRVGSHAEIVLIQFE
jgi:predicted MPP superfamily phosphohydrolase